MRLDEEKRIKNLQIVDKHLRTGASTRQKAAETAGSKSGFLKKWGALGVPIVFLLGKMKWLLAILKFTKFSTLITMFVAVWVYAQIWGMPFAVGFILLIYVHEMGHAIMMYRLGLRAGAPIFIPFVGAVISMKDLPKNAYHESLVAAGGPLLGTLGAMVCLALGWYQKSDFMYALASTGFFLNLFNMLPVSPLDGGRMTGAVSRNFKLVGLVLGGVVFYLTRSPILMIILILGVISLFRKDNGPGPEYYNVPKAKRWGIGVLYFSMLFIMTLGMWLADKPIQHLVG